LELTGIDHPGRLVGGQTNLCRNRKSRQKLISSQHDSGYTGVVQPPDEVLNAWPDGAAETGEPEPGQVVAVWGLGVAIERIILSKGKGGHAKARARHLCIRGFDGGAAIGCQVAATTVRRALVTTPRENVFGAAFYCYQETSPFSVCSHHETVRISPLLQA